jgi:dinuclear metal center YbgI/SA1388 family protein
MLISTVIESLESLAHPSLQEHYDNAGLITGNPDWELTGILCALDSTEDVIDEAIGRKCNMVIAHHPIVFGGLRKISGNNYVGRIVIKAIKNDIAIYAIHTNLDNVVTGVSGKMAAMLGLENIRILSPKQNTLRKLFVFVPQQHAAAVRQAIFNAGGGHIGNYSECSFNTEGTGTYKAGQGARPFAGEIGESHQEAELKIEVIFPAYLERNIIRDMIAAHPYEEVAYDIVSLANPDSRTGSGVVGDLPSPMAGKEMIEKLKTVFQVPVVRHTRLPGLPVRRVALCGGAGSFLIPNALGAGADMFITADLKYHEFFEATDKMVIADIGHYESEQFTTDLVIAYLAEKFPTFAVLKSGISTNPVYYS